MDEKVFFFFVVVVVVFVAARRNFIAIFLYDFLILGCTPDFVRHSWLGTPLLRCQAVVSFFLFPYVFLIVDTIVLQKQQHTNVYENE